jgi:cobalt/nickel transport system permease protein
MQRITVTLLLLMAPLPAEAMHIAEGILPLPWGALWFGVSAPFVALGIRRLNLLGREDLAMKPLVGLLAAVVFIISCLPIPVPTAGTCSHPCGTAISAILVGPLISVLISSVALLIQALVMAHGGLSTLGADILSMGVVGSFVGYTVFRSLRSCGAGLGSAAFCAGVLTDWATYLTTSMELAGGIRGAEPFWPLALKIVIAFIPTQLPLGVLEGAMTAGMVSLLARKRPDLLVRMKLLHPGEASGHA